MANSQEKVAEAGKMMKKADKVTKLSFTRWSADWISATPLYEQAALSFRFAKEYEKAKDAYLKAATGQERLSSPWQAAKHFESAASLAKEVENWNEVIDLYKRASELYTECGQPQAASDALARGARAIEDALPEQAAIMYMDACGILEEEGKEQMAFDIYRSATNVYLKINSLKDNFGVLRLARLCKLTQSGRSDECNKSETHLGEAEESNKSETHLGEFLTPASQDRFTDAATTLLRWGLAADKCKAVHSQCKAYLSAIIVYLHANDLKQAEQCFNDCLGIDAFSNSDQCYCAEKLLQAYREADVEDIKYITQSNSAIKNLDHMIVRLARNLPTGDVSTLASSDTKEEPLDENDLT